MSKVKKIIVIIVLIILTPILFINGVILVNSYTHPEKIPSFFGWKPFIVLSGSMESQIYPGDIVVVKETNLDELKENEIIAFREDDIVITHRIIEIVKENGETKYITKGDNNNTQDSGYGAENQIEGVYRFKIKRLGNLAMFIQTPIGIVICLSIPLILLILVQMSSNRAIMKEKELEEKNMKEELEKLRKQNEELKNK